MRYLTAIASILFSFYNIMLLSLFNSFSPLLLQRFHLSTADYGLFAGCDLIANGLGLILIGPLLDKYGSRKVGIGFITLATVSCLVLATSNYIALDYFARFCQGLASAASLLICLRTALTFFEEKASLAVSTMIAFAFIGGLVGNSVFSLLAKNFGLTVGFLIAAVIGFVVLIFALLFLQEKQAHQQQSMLDIKQMLSYFKKPLYLQSGLLIGLFCIPIFVFGALWGLYFLKHSGSHLSTAAMGFDSGLIFIGVIIGSPCWGWLAEKFNISLNIVKGCCAASIALSFVLLFSQVPSLLLAFTFFGLGFLCSSQNLIYPFLGKSDNKTLSAITGFVCLLANLIGAFLEWFYGVLVHYYGNSNLHNLTFLFFFVTFWICLGLGFNMKRRFLSGVSA